MTKLGIWVIVTIFAVSMTVIPALAGGHVFFDTFSASNDDKNTSTVESEMTGSFEGAEGTGLFGIVAFGEQNKHLAVTSHATVADSEIDGGGEDGTSHTHVLKVKVTENCATTITTNPEGLEGLAVRSVSFKTIGELTVDGAEITVSEITARGVGGHLTGDGASFFLVPVEPDLCIRIMDTFPD